MPQFLDIPAAWLSFISAILGIISFFLPTNPSIHIDNSTNYYFETRESKSTQGLDLFIIVFSFLGIFISYSLIYPYFFYNNCIFIFYNDSKVSYFTNNLHF